MALSRFSRSSNLLSGFARYPYTAELGGPRCYTSMYLNCLSKQCGNTIAKLSVKNELVVNKSFSTFCRERSILFFGDKRNIESNQILINGNTRFSNTLTKIAQANGSLPIYNYTPSVQFSTNVDEKKTKPKQAEVPPGYEPPRTQLEALKRAMKTYGPIILIFHISHSLVLLGIIYVLVARGVDLMPYVQKISDADLGEWNKMLVTSGTFAASYALYKCTAPIRIAVTLAGFSTVIKLLRGLGFKITPPGKVQPLPTNITPKN